MNRKNTILIAVLINAGLLAVLLIAALATQEEGPPTPKMAAEPSLQLPQFEDVPLFKEIPLQEPVKSLEIPIAVTEEPLIHKLPPLVVAERRVPEIAAAEPPRNTQLEVQSSSLPPLSFSATGPGPRGMVEVVVKKGDNLEKIAKAHQTTVDEIIKINHLPSSFLKVGQVLKIPAERSLTAARATARASAEKKAAELGPEYYTMKVGDNPWAIAMKHHMKVEELLRLNGLNEERARKLKPGDRLRIR